MSRGYYAAARRPSKLPIGQSRRWAGLRFAAFGRVIRGMDVVRRIHTAPADGQRLAPVIRIQRAIRRE